MKDVRGAHVSIVRTAIFKTFALQSLTSKNRKNSHDLLAWKKSKEVVDSYSQLYADRRAIENITNAAFPSLTTVTDDKFNDIYIYTASVCDMILNPDYPSLKISKKGLELRIQRFKVLFVGFSYFVFF